MCAVLSEIHLKGSGSEHFQNGASHSLLMLIWGLAALATGISVLNVQFVLVRGQFGMLSSQDEQVNAILPHDEDPGWPGLGITSARDRNASKKQKRRLMDASQLQLTFLKEAIEVESSDDEPHRHSRSPEH